MANKCPKCHSDNPETLKFCGECGTSLHTTRDAHPEATETIRTPIHELTTGSTFAGRYQVIEELGRGGMGRVYKVYDAKIKEKIALKLIRPEVASDRETIERFGNEIRLARRIGHRNVCKMFDLGEAEGSHFITMEYVPGEDLKSMIRMSGSLSLGMLLAVGRQVADGLAEAHGLGVVHRDLKPQNIMIDRNGNAKIMDFGIARSVREKGMTGPSVMIGTPEYMSPEQAEAKEVDHRSDIYSLGVILYEMATSRVPFEGETALSVAMKHKAESPKNPKKLNPSLPDDLAGVILKCLEKDRANRYQGAADVRDELERIEKGLPTTERVVPDRKPLTSRQITVQFSLKKLLVPALAAVAVIAAGVLFWSVLPHKKTPLAPSDQPSLAVLYFENISADPSLDDWKTGLTELLITDLSQSRLINVLGSDRVYGLLKKLGLEQAGKYSSDDLIRVAEEGRVAYTGNGSILKAGESIIITFALRNPRTGEAIRPHKMECRGEVEIASKIDELTRLIKTDLHLTSAQISADPDKELGEITTSSPEARRFFLEGQRYNLQGDYAQSIESFKKAVALDPEFAMAWRAMAGSHMNMGNMAEYERQLKKALDFSGRISERERLLIQSEAEKKPDRAIEIGRKLVELYPADRRARQTLGINYVYIEEWDKALEQHAWNHRADKGNSIFLSNVMDAYHAKGLYAEAERIAEEFSATFPDNSVVRISLAANRLCAGDPARALEEVDRAYALAPTNRGLIFLKGDILHCGGDLEKAEAEYRKLLHPDDPVSSTWGRTGLWSLALLQGRYRHGLEELTQAIKLVEGIEPKYQEATIRRRLSYNHLIMGHLKESLAEAGRALEIGEGVDTHWTQEELVQHWGLWPLLMKGLCYLQMGSAEKASRIAGEIEALNLYPAERRWHLYIIGLIELVRKNDAAAVLHLEEALSLDPHQWGADNKAFFLEALARAYFQSGDQENARKRYEEITGLTTGRLRYGDIFAKSFYMLGKIAEGRREISRARENYLKFLELWNDADPGLPEVEDARKRLAAIR